MNSLFVLLFINFIVCLQLVRDMTVYFPLDNFYEEGSIDSIVPGPSGLPDRVQVSKTRWSEDIPPIYHFSSNELLVYYRVAETSIPQEGFEDLTQD